MLKCSTGNIEKIVANTRFYYHQPRVMDKAATSFTGGPGSIPAKSSEPATLNYPV